MKKRCRIVIKSIAHKKVYESVISPNDIPKFTSNRILNMNTMILTSIIDPSRPSFLGGGKIGRNTNYKKITNNISGIYFLNRFHIFILEILYLFQGEEKLFF